MKRLALLALLLVTACAPRLEQGDGLTYDGERLQLFTPGMIEYAFSRVQGAVSSPLCELEGCAAAPDGWIYIDLLPPSPLPPPQLLATGRIDRAEVTYLVQGDRTTRKDALGPP